MMAPLREGWSLWVWRKRTCTSLEAPAPQCPELGPLRGPQDINPLLSSLRPGQIGGCRFCCPRGKWGWIGAGQLSLPGAHHLDLHPPLPHPAPPSWAAGQASLTPTARCGGGRRDLWPSTAFSVLTGPLTTFPGPVAEDEEGQAGLGPSFWGQEEAREAWIEPEGTLGLLSRLGGAVPGRQYD